MNIEFRITKALLKIIHDDLSREHAFSAERVGFISCSAASLPNDNLLLLCESYLPVEDSHYIKSYKYGALIDTNAIRIALQHSYQNQKCMFHIHRHDHTGNPSFSSIDLRESNKLIPNFWNVQPNLPHGIIVLSYDSISGICWIPKGPKKLPIRKFTLVNNQIISNGGWLA